MLVIRLMISRIKAILRTKEFYFYVIGFPLVFLLLFTFFQPISSAQTRTLTIGVVNNDDAPVTDTDLNITYSWSDDFINRLKSTDPLTNLTYFNVKSYENVSIMEKDIANLRISGGIHIPTNFSRQVTRYIKSQAYFIMASKLSSYLNENSSADPRIGPVIDELSRNASEINATIRLEYYGDAAFSSTHAGYTRAWQVLPQFLEMALTRELPNIWQHLQQVFNLTDIQLDISNDATDGNNERITFDISLIQAGTKGALENIQQEYFARLVPGQIIQSVLMLSTGVVVFVGEEKRTGVLKRLKLTRMTAGEYLMGNFLAWGAVALIQTLLFVVIASLLGTVPLELRPVELIFIIIAVFLAGLMSASIAYVVGAYINYRAAIPLLSLVLITGSLITFEYFVSVQDVLLDFFGQPLTMFDLAPWRAPFLVVKKGLMLPRLFEWPDLVINLVMSFLWAAVLLGLAIYVFQRRIFRYAEEE